MKEKEVFRTTLAVNDIQLALNPFIADFVARVASGIVLSLKGVEYAQQAEIYLNGDKAKVIVNGMHIPTDSFANNMIVATLTGMVSILKGGEDIESLVVTVESHAV